MTRPLEHRRCPVCAKRGYRRIAWVGPQLIGTCRGGHPYILEQRP